MRQFIKIILSGLIIFNLVSCDNKEDTIFMKEWLISLAVQTGLSEKEDSWSKISDCLIQWGIREDLVYSDEKVTKEKAAAVFSDWIWNKVDTALSFKDENETVYSDEIKICLKNKILHLDKQGYFHPKQKLSLNESMEWIEHFIFYINHENQEEFLEMTLKDNEFVECLPYQFDLNEKKAIFHPEQILKKGDYVFFEWENKHYYYQIDSVSEGITELKEIPLDEIDYIRLSTSSNFDWDNAEWILPGDVIDNNNQNSDFSPVSSSNEFIKEFKYKDYTIRLNYNRSLLSAYIFKKTDLNANFFAELNITDINPVFIYEGDLTHIDRYLSKISFDTSIATGLKKGNYRQLVLDPDKVKTDDWLDSLKSAWSSKRSNIDMVIPIGELRVPVSGIPQIQLILQLQLRVYMNGRVEFVYQIDNIIGMEVRNNQIRTIRDYKQDFDFIIQASCGLTAKALFGFSVMNQWLTDIAMETGIKGLVKSTLHLGENDNKIEEELIPYDILDEILKKEENIVICGDLSAYSTLNIQFNSVNSLAGKMGLGKTVEILNQNNGSLFQGKVQHIENMIFVDHCTKRKNHKPIPTISVNTSRILLDSYTLLIEKGKSVYIEIRGLPEGVKKTDLIFSSNHTQIATVNEKGLITGIKEGTAEITVMTKDKYHYVQCSVLVKGS